MMREKPRGFTLIELLIAVAIIGIVAAIAIPALTSALQRARQKRTMVELRTVATAVSSYATDFAFVPRVASGNVESLTGYLCPTYVRSLPSDDAWHTPMLFESEGLDYTVRSLGSDGVAQGSLTLGPTTNFADDIIIVDGVFAQWPEGMQTN
jgi:type II secretion system protein G